MSPPNATLDAPTELAKLQEASLDSYEGVERFPFRPYPKTHRLYWTQSEMPPESRHKKDSPRSDGQSVEAEESTAEGAALLVRVNKTLKNKVAKAVKKSGLSQKEFLVTALERAVEETINPTNETLALSQEALTKTHAAEEALRRLTRSLSSRNSR